MSCTLAATMSGDTLCIWLMLSSYMAASVSGAVSGEDRCDMTMALWRTRYAWFSSLPLQHSCRILQQGKENNRKKRVSVVRMLAGRRRTGGSMRSTRVGVVMMVMSLKISTKVHGHAHLWHCLPLSMTHRPSRV